MQISQFKKTVVNHFRHNFLIFINSCSPRNPIQNPFLMAISSFMFADILTKKETFTNSTLKNFQVVGLSYEINWKRLFLQSEAYETFLYLLSNTNKLHGHCSSVYPLCWRNMLQCHNILPIVDVVSLNR